MKINFKLKIAITLIAAIVAFTGCKEKLKSFESENKYASIFPDYNNIVIPPNIAPINFLIKEKAIKYQVEIYSKKGERLIIQQGSPSIQIPQNAWRELLNENKGNNLFIDIYCKNEKWSKFNTIIDSVAREPIDSYLAYRLINNPTAYTYWDRMGIYQRNLETFDESPVYVNTSAIEGCVNCHSFAKGNPNEMSLHFRKSQPGTMILDGEKIRKINSKTKAMMTPFVYPGWHPSGKYAAFAVNLILLNFPASRNVVSELSDKASDIFIYNVKTNTVTTSPKIATKSRENFPYWSPDGKYLYFISAPEAEKNNISSRILGRYSLLRIPFDAATEKWGDVDTVLSANKTKLSITLPTVSPDCRYVLFTMLDHGYFSIYDFKSDIYIMDLKTNEYHKLNINSNSNESYHGWSQNGRWIVFSSKRLDNIYTLTYFSYFDKNGNTHKPFVMPQKNPLFYATSMLNYNRPELITGKIKLNPRQLRDFVYTEPENVKLDPKLDVDALSGATWIKNKK